MGRIGAMLAAAALVAGCSGEGADAEEDVGSALVGMYAVERYAVDDAGCGEGTESTWDAPYLEVAVETFFGVDALVVYPCASETECDSGVFSASYIFETFDDVGAEGTTEAAAHSEQTCWLTWGEHTLTSEGGGIVVRSEILEADEEVTAVDLDACMAAQETYDGPRSCTRATVLEAVPL